MIQYSSNEGDLVCDFFLGGFSTAKVALGLNHRAIGFEISRPMFDAKIKEIETLRPGSLIPSLRHSVAQTPENRGKSWTQEDRIRLQEEYVRLISKGTTKKELIAQLGEKFGRGRWSIEKALKKNGFAEKKRTAKKTSSYRILAADRFNRTERGHGLVYPQKQIFPSPARG